MRIDSLEHAEHAEASAPGAEEDDEVNYAPPPVARTELVWQLVGEKEQAPISRLAQDMDAFGRARPHFGVARPHLALRLEARELPLLQADLAVAIEVEALLQVPLVRFPLRQQRTDIGALLAGSDRSRG